MNVWQTLKSRFIAAVGAAGLLAAPAYAENQNAAPTSPQPDTQAETADDAPRMVEIQTRDGVAIVRHSVWMDAQDYSLENVAIAYAAYGRTSRYTNAEMIAGINELFRRQGLNPDEQVKAFSAVPDRLGVGIGFYVDGVEISRNTMSLGETIEYIRSGEPVSMYLEHAPIMRARLEEGHRRGRTTQSAPAGSSIQQSDASRPSGLD